MARRAGRLDVFKPCLWIADLSHRHVPDVLSFGKSGSADYHH